MKSFITQGARILVLGSLIYVCPATGFSQQAAAPDNTKNNQENSVTAEQQSNTPADRELTQQVRKAIMDDSSLSTYAHNVKIIAQSGQVTLKGPVRSQTEKAAVEAKAADVAGKDKVVNELTVAPDSH